MMRIRGTIGELPVDLTLELDDSDWARLGVHLQTATPVTGGAYAVESVPVLSGVNANDWVVAAGGHLLREGQPVTAVDRQNRPVLAPAAKPAAADAPAAGKGN